MAEKKSGKTAVHGPVSPENMDESIRVIRPGVWIVLGCTVLLLLAACIWGIFGRIRSRIFVKAEVLNGVTACRIEEGALARVCVGQKARIGEMTGTVCEVGTETKDGYGYCMIRPDGTAEDGVYEGYIITEEYRPISFIIN